LAIEGIETLDATAHEGTEQDVSVMINGTAQHGGQGENGVPIDDAFVEPVAEVADKVIDVDFSTAQT
jgi:hypothetical protein